MNLLGVKEQVSSSQTENEALGPENGKGKQGFEKKEGPGLLPWENKKISGLGVIANHLKEKGR